MKLHKRELKKGRIADHYMEAWEDLPASEQHHAALQWFAIADKAIAVKSLNTLDGGDHIEHFFSITENDDDLADVAIRVAGRIENALAQQLVEAWSQRTTRLRPCLEGISGERLHQIFVHAIEQGFVDGQNDRKE